MRLKLANTAALALGLALVAACGGGSDEPSESAPTPPAETEAETTDAAEAGETETADAETPAAEPEAEAPSQFAGFPEPYATADFNRGKRVFLQCQSCHTLEEGGPAVLGPNLYGLFGRKVGEGEGFQYSTALQDADFTWTPDQLESWLENPRTFLPGNKMSFAGVQRPDDRHAVIAYVMSQTGYTPE